MVEYKKISQAGKRGKSVYISKKMLKELGIEDNCNIKVELKGSKIIIEKCSNEKVINDLKV